MITREYRNFTREEKIKAVKMVLIDKKSQMEVERTVLGKKKCTGTINRWIREYIQEGEENCFKKRKGLKKVEITEENVRYEILKKFNAFLEKEMHTNFFFSVKISIPLENTGVSSVFASLIWPFSLIFSLARRNEGNFFQAVPTTLSSSLAEVRLASLVAWA